MPKPTFLNLPDEKRQRIIDMALEEFASKPYSKASLTNIVSRAGIAKGSMYQYFEDKNDLYRYLLDFAAAEKMACMVQVEIESTGDFYETLEKIMMAGARFNLAHPELGRVIANARGPAGDEAVQEFMASGRKMFHKYFVGLLAKGQNNKSVKEGIDLNLTSYLLIGTISEGLTYYVTDFLGFGLRELMVSPESAAAITEADLLRMIRETIRFLREGLEPKE